MYCVKGENKNMVQRNKVLDKICLYEKQLYLAKWYQDYETTLKLEKELKQLREEKEQMEQHWQRQYTHFHQLRIRKEMLENEENYSAEEWNRISHAMEKIRRECVGQEKFTNYLQIQSCT